MTAIILTTPAAAMPDGAGGRDGFHSVVGWLVVMTPMVIAVVACWFGFRCAIPARSTTRSIAVQTDAETDRFPAAVVTRTVTRMPESVFMTRAGKKFHVSRLCAESRTSDAVVKHDRCLVCAR